MGAGFSWPCRKLQSRVFFYPEPSTSSWSSVVCHAVWLRIYALSGVAQGHTSVLPLCQGYSYCAIVQCHCVSFNDAPLRCCLRLSCLLHLVSTMLVCPLITISVMAPLLVPTLLLPTSGLASGLRAACPRAVRPGCRLEGPCECRRCRRKMAFAGHCRGAVLLMNGQASWVPWSFDVFPISVCRWTFTQ